MAQTQFEIGDILASSKAWDDYKAQWLSDLKKAKQPEPTPIQIASLHETFIEFWLMGRTSNADTISN